MTNRLRVGESASQTVLNVAEGCQSNKIRWLAFILAAISFLIHLPIYLTPWVGGVDPVTRLANIDQLIVVVLGNPWLPATQLLVQLVGMVSDTAMAYKLVIGAVAAMAVFFSLLVINCWSGVWAMLYGWLFFVLSNQWQMVATSVYMEPLALLSLSSSIYFLQKGGRMSAAALFVVGTFSRPEYVIAAPAVILSHYMIYGDGRRTVRISLLFLPIVAYYLVLKVILPGFENPGRFDISISSLLLYKLFVGYWHQPVFIFSAVLALIGLLLLLLRKDFLIGRLRRPLLILPVGWFIFVATFAVFTPIAHGYCPGGTRHTLLTTLPVWLYSAVFVELLAQRYRWLVRFSMVILSVVAVIIRVSGSYPKPPHYFAAVQEVSAALRLKMAPGTRDIFLCNLDSGELRAENVHPIDRNPIVLYLRFAGINLKPISCAANLPEWRELVAKGQRPVLRIYRPNGLTTEYEELLTEGCQFSKEIHKAGRLVAAVCF